MLPFLLTLDKGEQVFHLGSELIFGTKNLARVRHPNFRAIEQAMSRGEAINRFARKIVAQNKRFFNMFYLPPTLTMVANPKIKGKVASAADVFIILLVVRFSWPSLFRDCATR